MAESKGGGGSDIWWFIGIMAIFFLLWVSTGGPQRAEDQGLGEVKVGQKYYDENGVWREENQTPTTTPSGQPKYSGDGQILY